MQLPDRLSQILSSAFDGHGPTKDDCVYLLDFPERSLEARFLMAVADGVSRRRFGNQAMLLGQIGIETAPCPGNCGFCVFGEGHTQFPRNQMPLEEVLACAKAFAREGDLYALFLMTMHDFALDHLLEVIHAARKCIPPQTQIVVNIGDFDAAQASELRRSRRPRGVSRLPPPGRHGH